MVICPSVSTTARSFFLHFESTEGIYEDSKQYVNAMYYLNLTAEYQGSVLYQNIPVSSLRCRR